MLNNWYQRCRNLEEALSHWDELSELRPQAGDERYSEYQEIFGTDKVWLEEMGIKW